MDALITAAIVIAAALWGVSRIFRRPDASGSRGCASGCDGCPLAGHGAHGAPGGCGAALVHDSTEAGVPRRAKAVTRETEGR